MSARLLYVPMPMVPELGAVGVPALCGQTVSEVLAQHSLMPAPTTVLLRGGKLVKRAEWDAEPINDNEEVRLVVMPLGDDGSQIAGIVASIALAIFAPGIGAWLAGSLSGLIGTTVLGVSTSSLFTVGTLVGGQSLISALLPPPKPYAQAGTASPTYDVAAQSNRARLGYAIPDIGGRNMVMCDLITAPYFEFEGNVQVVKQVVAVGVGHYDIEAIRLSQAVIWADGAATGAYPEVELEICGPDDPVTLIEDNVATSTEVSSLELKGDNEDGGGYVGPFPISRAGTSPTHIGIDIGFQALVGSDDGATAAATVSFELQVQAIDNNGVPNGLWFTILEDTITRQTRSPLRLSYKVVLPGGRRQARMKRTNDKSTDKNTVDTMGWLAMRAYMPSISDYPKITKIAMKARGTANLNGDALQKLNAIVTRKLPAATIDPGSGAITWGALTATRNPAWYAAYMLRDPSLAGLADNRFAVAQLVSLAATWADRGDWFDGVFDSRKSLWDNLQSVLNVGRSRAYIAGSQVAFVRDEPKSVPSGVFSPRNMLPGSFGIDFTFNQVNAVSALRMQFIDNRTWAQNEVLCALPDYTGQPEDAPPMQVFGSTDRDHVWRDGMFLVAQSRYRRIAPSFKTAMEGRACFPGSLIRVGHWLASWGKAAKVMRLTRKDDGDELLLSEPWAPGEGHEGEDMLATITSPDGREYGPVAFQLLDDGSDTRKAVIKLLDTAELVGKYAGTQPRDWPVWYGDGLKLERPRIILGTATEQPVGALVTEMAPDAGGRTVSVTSIVDDPRVHAADQGEPPAEVGGPENTDTPDLTITSVGIAESLDGDDIVATITVAGAADAVSFDLHWKLGTDAFRTIVRDLARPFTFRPDEGVVTLEVRAKGAIGYGPWFAKTFYANGITDVIPSDVGTVSTNGDPDGATNSLEVNNYDWAAVAGATSYLVEVWSRKNGSGDWVQRRADEVMIPSYTRYPAQEIDEGGPWHDTYIQVKAKNNAGTSPDWSQSDDGT